MNICFYVCLVPFVLILYGNIYVIFLYTFLIINVALFGFLKCIDFILNCISNQLFWIIFYSSLAIFSVIILPDYLFSIHGYIKSLKNHTKVQKEITYAFTRKYDEMNNLDWVNVYKYVHTYITHYYFKFMLHATSNSCNRFTFFLMFDTVNQNNNLYVKTEN